MPKDKLECLKKRRKLKVEIAELEKHIYLPAMTDHDVSHLVKDAENAKLSEMSEHRTFDNPKLANTITAQSVEEIAKEWSDFNCLPHQTLQSCPTMNFSLPSLMTEGDHYLRTRRSVSYLINSGYQPSFSFVTIFS